MGGHLKDKVAWRPSVGHGIPIAQPKGLQGAFECGQYVNFRHLPRLTRRCLLYAL